LQKSSAPLKHPHIYIKLKYVINTAVFFHINALLAPFYLHSTYKKTKADGSRLIPRKHTETLVLLSVYLHVCTSQMSRGCKKTKFV